MLMYVFTESLLILREVAGVWLMVKRGEGSVEERCLRSDSNGVGLAWD